MLLSIPLTLKEKLYRYGLLAAIIAIALIISFSNMNPFSINDSGYRTHVQRLGGEEFVRFEPGLYYAGFFAKRTKYPDVVTIMYSESKPGEDVTSMNEPFEIRFSDATKADAQATVRWRLPSNDKEMIQIHKEYRNVDRLAETSLNKYTRECLKYAAQLMESETHYSGGMSKLSEDFQDQLENGQYIIEYKTEYVVDSISKEKARITRTYVRTNASGLPERNTSDIQQFNIVPAVATIDQIDYEAQVDEKLAQKIEASTRESISKQRLITAQQEALTAIEEGKKMVEETRAKELASKEEAVIRAQKDKEVEREKSEQAKYTAAKIKAEKDAEAAANEALVRAGLTPQERAEWDYKTQVGVAEQLAKIQFPELMIIGNDGKGGQLDPFNAIGLKSFMEIQKGLTK